MKSGKLRGAIALLVLGIGLCFALPALAQTAADITAKCSFNAGSGRKTFRRCTDRNYRTWWQSGNGASARLEVTVKARGGASLVWVQWYEHPHAWALEIPDDQGGWIEYAHTEGLYLSETLPLPEGTTRFRLVNAPGTTRRFMLAELHIYGSGEIPPEVQQWNPAVEKADLMLLAAHPDDEVLWFGGTLPVYAGIRGKACQVCMMVPTMPYRRLELLDCLWTCGVKNYPVWGGFSDSFSSTLNRQYTHWSKNRVYRTVTEWIRRFRPEVLLTHDLKGEYGHGAHRVCGDAAIHCLALAADEKKYPDSAKEYGCWDVPKCYLHLYPENQIDMDWQQPLEAFGGKTAFEIAEAAFRCHRSQQSTDYRVKDSGPTDCSLFGLYRSLVGPDEAMDDFFEHLEADRP